MNKNDIFEIEITGMTDEGSGVGRAEGIAVFVPYTIVGEIVRIHIIKVNKSYAIGKLLEVIKPSSHRVKAECEYFYQCGGCQLWHMDYEAELEFKQKKVADCIERIGGIDTPVSAIVGAEKASRYRNKTQMPVSLDGVGFYKRNSHTVIDMRDCLLQKQEASEVVKAVRKWILDFGIQPYDEKSGNGLIRNIYTRTGEENIAVVIVTNEEELPYKRELIDRILKTGLSVSGIIQNINPDRTNVVLGRRNVVLWGKGYVTDGIGDTRFEISPNSFYQVNKEQTYNLYSIARRMANLSGSETVWDLYCGIGTIGQFMSNKAKKIVGIEIVPDAIENAVKNAENNNIENAEYFCGAAENVALELVKKGYRADVVILDPPRKGCDSKLLDTVARLKPKRIVYISCKPSTLARDLKYLDEKGYKTKEIVPVDMFPRTCHVETVCLLSQS